MTGPRLEMKNITKEYFGNKVLKGINISVQPGEVHAIVGENGAGKSTLMNILFGMPVIHNTGGYKGKITFNGSSAPISSPEEAMEMGIGMVHQEFMLLPGFTIMENIKLNREPTLPNIWSSIFGEKMRTLDIPRMRRDAKAALERLDLNIDEMLQVAGLPVGFMQFVEIARELDKTSLQLLVLDEPTAVLTENDAETLLKSVRRMANEGISVLFITHRLDEVLSVADRITVLRDGEQVATMNPSEATVEKLAELMVGRKIKSILHKDREADSDRNTQPLLSIKNLHVQMPGEEVNGVDLEVMPGEILGLGGLAGHGKIGVANGIMGFYPASGEITVKGKQIPLNSSIASLNSGMAFVSEDRRGVGLLLEESVEMNIIVQAMQSQGKFLKRRIIEMMDAKTARKHTDRMIKDLDIRCTGPEQLTRRLSGGNQQKVCIAKALTLEPNILFVSEPTRGIDVGAKRLILDLLVELNRKSGVTIVMTSSELSELRSICDRIAIIYKGRLEGILSPDESNAKYGLMMAGALAHKRKAAS
ncbi:MAG: sugar ABC transporter ATP-binding protein [Thermovirgaceae bacterium]|nr:sugar ABC transporter ATP-binding protein [Thermovirgaceae bacterium]